MNKRKYMLILSVTFLVFALTACGSDTDTAVTETGFIEQETVNDEIIHTPQYESTAASTATTSSVTTKAATTAKTTTAATTAATAKKSSVQLSSGSGSQLMSIRKAFEQDGTVYISGVYLKEGEEVTDEDGEVYTDLPEEKDGKTHSFILSPSASIAFSSDFGPDTTQIGTKEFISKFNGLNDGSGINYTATIKGDTVTALKFYYIP